MLHLLRDAACSAVALSLMGVAALATPGCAAANHTQAGAALGTGLGALTGAMIGSDSGHAGKGALIGAATGALVGGALGNAEDERERQIAAVAHAQHVQQAEQALTNDDLVRMTQNGISDEVIISTVKTRGGQFDFSPDAIIQLKNQGVSDQVIIGVQQAAAKSTLTAVPASPPGVRPDVVVVPSAVSLGVVVGPRPVVRPRPRFYVGHHFYHRW